MHRIVNLMNPQGRVVVTASEVQNMKQNDNELPSFKNFAGLKDENGKAIKHFGMMDGSDFQLLLSLSTKQTMQCLLCQGTQSKTCFTQYCGKLLPFLLDSCHKLFFFDINIDSSCPSFHSLPILNEIWLNDRMGCWMLGVHGNS